jgi:hypothetical protein
MMPNHIMVQVLTVCIHKNEIIEMSYTGPLNVKEHTQYNLTNIYLWFEFLQVR